MGRFDQNGHWDDADRNVGGDPYRVSAEVFARDVERYLHREYNPDGTPFKGYRNPDFLNWAVARFDTTKTGGHHFGLDYDFDNPENSEALVVNRPSAAPVPETPVAKPVQEVAE